jgi:TolA-binding protein
MFGYLVRLFGPWLIGALALGGGWLYTTYQSNELETLRANNSALEQAQEQNQATIGRLLENVEQANENIEELRERTIEAENYQDQLLSRFREHELTILSLRKPGLIESRVNNATREIFDQIESDTITE